MPDRRDDLDHRLAHRLRAYESELPAGDAPGTDRLFRGRRWPTVLGVTATAIAAGTLIGAVLLMVPRIDVAQSSPSPTPTAAATAAPTPTSPPASGTPRPTPSSTASPSATPDPTAAATPAPTPIPSGAAALAWSRGAAPDSPVYAVTRVADRWIAVGSLDDRAAAWTSADGLTWSPSAAIDPAPLPSTETDPGTGYGMTALIDYQGEIIAFGWNRIGCCDGGRPMAWRSPNGSAWELVPTDGSAFDAYQFPTTAALAPGGELVLLASTGLGSGASAFVTSDLDAWTEHVITDVDTGDRPLHDLAASPSLIVAVGGVWDSEGTGRQQVWISNDGRTWTGAPAPEQLGELSTIAWDPARERFVAGGRDGEGRPAIYLSADAQGWSKVPLGDGEGWVRAIDAADGLIVATGWTGPLLESEGVAWSSHDGVTWHITPMRLPARAVAVGSGVAVAFGEGGGEAPDHVPEWEVWVGTR